jgi:hypothetical protein
MGEMPLLQKHPTLQPASLAGGEAESEGDPAMSMVQNEKTQGKRRPRPLTSLQERLFFGALFVIAALVQVSVVWAQIVR